MMSPIKEELWLMNLIRNELSTFKLIYEKNSTKKDNVDSKETEKCSTLVLSCANWPLSYLQEQTKANSIIQLDKLVSFVFSARFFNQDFNNL